VTIGVYAGCGWKGPTDITDPTHRANGAVLNLQYIDE